MTSHTRAGAHHVVVEHRKIEPRARPPAPSKQAAATAERARNVAMALWRRRSLLSISEHALVRRLVGAEAITGDELRQIAAIVARLALAPRPPPPRKDTP